VPTVLQSQLLPGSLEASYLEYNRILPLETTETHVRIAVCGDPDPDVIADLEREFGRPVQLTSVSAEELADGIRRAYAAAESMIEVVHDLRTRDALAGGDEQALADARDLASQPPVVKYVNLLIKEAHDARASDIHLESSARGLPPGSASTASSRTPPRHPRKRKPRSSAASSCLASSISRNAASRRTEAFAFDSKPASSISGSPPCPRYTASPWCSDCSIAAVSR
jgi:hypothetical protein